MKKRKILLILLIFFLQRSENPLNMVEKWTLCIEVSCYPNPRQFMITYVLYNSPMNKALKRKGNVPGRKTNNEAYYIALIEGIGNSREYGSNVIVFFTIFELVCRQMKGMYQDKKENLKQLHKNNNNIVNQFQSFIISHCANVNMISSDLFYGAIPIQDLCVKDELVSRSSP